MGRYSKKGFLPRNQEHCNIHVSTMRNEIIRSMVVEKVAVDILEPNGRERFSACGELVLPGEDGAVFDPSSSMDCDLDLSQGTPRFYIMRLRDREKRFDRITYHEKVTQCLALSSPSTLSGWYLAVAPPTYTQGDETVVYPDLEKGVVVYRIPHGVIVKLHKGTWHAGPLWDPKEASVAEFMNLELSDTNVVDHHTHVYGDGGAMVD